MFSSPREIHTLDSRFWLYHLWLPLVFVIPTLYLFEHSSIDVIFADFWYRLEGGYWALLLLKLAWRFKSPGNNQASQGAFP